MIQRYCEAVEGFIDVAECYGCPHDPDECKESEACKGEVKIDTIERIKQLEAENAELRKKLAEKIPEVKTEAIVEAVRNYKNANLPREFQRERDRIVPLAEAEIAEIRRIYV